jgi:putative spermidine/putrescine transport system permease protein
MESFPLILYSRLGIDIILAGIYKETPFAVIMIYAVLSRLDKRLIETALMLGAGSRQIFIRIILPHLVPVTGTVFIILFIYNIGSFEIPYVLGSSNPGMLSIRIFDYFFQKDLSMRPFAMAMLVVILIFSTLFIYLYSRLIAGVDIRDRKI